MCIRRRLLRALVSHYGLAARGPGFEKAAAAVAMPELADEADARSRFAEWIATTAEQPTGEVGPSTASDIPRVRGYAVCFLWKGL